MIYMSSIKQQKKYIIILEDCNVMKIVYLKENENSYKCPYCGVEIIDHSKDKMETENTYCGSCLKEFHIEVIK